MRQIISLTVIASALIFTCKEPAQSSSRTNAGGKAAATIVPPPAAPIQSGDAQPVQPQPAPTGDLPPTPPEVVSEPDPSEKPIEEAPAEEDPKEPSTAEEEPKDPPAPTMPPSSPPELKKLCDDAARVKTFELDEHFPHPPISCIWGSDSKPVDGNIGKKEQRISARLEEWRAISLPAGAMLCEMNLSFKDANGQPDQVMRYDDEIFVLFNDFILASSKDYNARFGRRANLPIYNWANLVGAPNVAADGRPIYCIDGSGTCAIPKTETKGIFNLTVKPETVQKMALELGAMYADGTKPAFANFPGAKLALGMVTTGDNDSPIDCMHKALYFRVTAKYVVP